MKNWTTRLLWTNQQLKWWILLWTRFPSALFLWTILVVFGPMEKDVLYTTMIMTFTVGVDLGFVLGCFLLIFYHIASMIKKGKSYYYSSSTKKGWSSKFLCLAPFSYLKLDHVVESRRSGTRASLVWFFRGRWTGLHYSKKLQTVRIRSLKGYWERKGPRLILELSLV